MEASRRIEQQKDSSKINAVVQVHSSLRTQMLPSGPLDGQADVIYMTNIASSHAPNQRPKEGEADVDELIFFLPHWPETIRFWIDERPVGHPEVSKEKVRKGGADDGRNCSVIKVCMDQGEGRKASPADPTAPRESDIYLPPSSRASRVWIYLDPKKSQERKEQDHRGPEKKSKVQFRESAASAPDSPVRRKSSTQKPKQRPHIPVSSGISIPARRSSKKAIPRSPLSANPPINGTTSPPPTTKQTTMPTDRPTPKPTAHLPQNRAPKQPAREPDGFRNDVFNDISRLMTNSDPFGRFHHDFPDVGDSDEERDAFPADPLHRDLPTLGQARRGNFYKTGRRAQSSTFFDQETLPGDRKIEIIHDEKPRETREFMRPSRRRRLRMRLSGMFHRRRHR